MSVWMGGVSEMQLVWASLPLLEGPDARLCWLWSPSGQR